MNLSIASEIATRAPSLRLGVLSMRGLTVRAKDDELWRCLAQASAAFAARCGINQLASDSRIIAVRLLQSAICSTAAHVQSHWRCVALPSVVGGAGAARGAR